jgi:hypothetical protein
MWGTGVEAGFRWSRHSEMPRAIRATPSFGDGQGPVEGLRQYGEGSGGDGAHGEEHGGPPGEDPGAEQCDAEDQAAEDVAGAGEVEKDLHVAYVAGGVAAGGGDDDVVDEAWGRVGEGREDDRGDDFGGEDEQVAGGEEGEPDKPEHAHLAHLPQVDAGDAGESEDAHDSLGGAADHPLVGVAEEAVRGWVVDLDGDEDGSGGRGTDGGGPGQGAGGSGFKRHFAFTQKRPMENLMEKQEAHPVTGAHREKPFSWAKPRHRMAGRGSLRYAPKQQGDRTIRDQ